MMKARISLLLLGAAVGALGPHWISAHELEFSELSEWRTVIAELVQEVYNSRESLELEYPEAELPITLDQWMNQLAQQSLVDSGGVAGQLNQVSIELSQQYGASQLTAGQQAVMGQYLALIRSLTEELKNGLGGQPYSSVDSYLSALTQLHDQDQQSINELGNELAQLFRALDFEAINQRLTEIKNQYEQSRS